MERNQKLELIQRMLAIKHKLKVHESLEHPQTHEELSYHLLSKWELEDELHAIEEIVALNRQKRVGDYKKLIEQGVIGKKKTTSGKTSSSNGSSSRRAST